ncbi:hypothetical protein AVEN_11681-1 [Araneus ventricosus]|uniref:Uncharacterized protein n=1 Tax=Araneus ventricosus TaxID=182803 RepID=A0A4Y2K5E2_ARAVE|nr:hypothetical protein AVEN_11681-1 [Araneus ventricosus]
MAAPVESEAYFALFQIISITKQSDEELEDVLTYELCPFPLPLFDERRWNAKRYETSLYKAFKPCTQDFNAEGDVYIIDGGYLLHRVIWKRSSTFSSICDKYLTHVRTKYKSTALVIFDGYPENETVGGTKCAERARRTQKKCQAKVATWLCFAAAHQHSLKVYYQIQHWLDNKKRPEDWGWERTNSRLQPVKILKTPVPYSILYVRYPASVRRGAQEIAAVGRSDCFVQCCILIIGATAITEGFKRERVINRDEDDDSEPILSNDLVEASLSLHVEEDTGDLSKDIGQ